MSVVRSVSVAELNQVNYQEGQGMVGLLCGTGNFEESENKDGFGCIMQSKAHTLDRFSRPSSMSQHGEKRKKRFFASFRLNKKSVTKSKTSQVSSNLCQMPENNDELTNTSSNDQEKPRSGDESSGSETSRTHKRYLTRMSSFVTRVANIKVQTNNSDNIPNSGIRGRLERSLTVAGHDLASDKFDYVQFEESFIPALTGIRNHGNTCFINAVMQCLSHTDILSEYFVLDIFKNDLARCNRLNSKKYGTKGEITEQLAVLLKSLWLIRYVPDISLNFKNVVEKYESCYRGSNQHDAAEFLMFVLDKVHEDLNTASKRKYKKVKNSYGRPDEIVAAETLANHLRCNSSFIQDVFQAQFRSSLKCPHCLKESNTFDPYLCVSVPIPQKEIITLFVTVVYLNQQPKQVKIGLTIEATATVKELRNIISLDCGICPEHLILTEIDGEGFHRTFTDCADINLIHASDPIYAIELTPQSESVQERDAFLLLTWINTVNAQPDNIRFGGVYQSQISRDVSYMDLQKLLLKEMSTMVSVNTLVLEQDNGIFIIRIDAGGKCVTLDPFLDVPLLHESIEEALVICHPNAGPPHVKLVCQWTMEMKSKYIIDDVDHVDEHSSVEELQKNPPECPPVTLNECLESHTSSEILSSGDAWLCPTCNRKQQVLKRLTLWSAPQILVIHLKRFRQASLGNNPSKLNTLVEFPLVGFDISEHMTVGRHTNNGIQPNNFEMNQTKVLSNGWSPWKRPKKLAENIFDNVYDLYAICNHHGSDLQGGHYTAVCRNPTNRKWYIFDDFNYELTTPQSLIDRDAYILFYQRRDDPSIPCLMDELGTSHWSYKIPLSTLPTALREIPSPETIKDISSCDSDPIIKPEDDGNYEENANDVNKCEAKTMDAVDSCDKQDSFDEQKMCDGSITKLVGGSSLVKTVIIADVESSQNEVCMDKIKAISTSNKIEIEDGVSKLNHVKQPADDDDVSKSLELRNNFNEISISESRRCSSAEMVESRKINVDPELVPEVRIQPASLEVLASHRYRSCPKNKLIKVTLRPKSQDTTSLGSDLKSWSKSRVNSRPSSVGSSSSSSSGSCCQNNSDAAPNEFENYSCSESDEPSPDVRINNGVEKNSFNVARSSYRRKVNNSPSYVIINTPISRSSSRVKSCNASTVSRLTNDSRSKRELSKERINPINEGIKDTSLRKCPALSCSERSLATAYKVEHIRKRSSLSANYDTLANKYEKPLSQKYEKSYKQSSSSSTRSEEIYTNYMAESSV